MSKKKIFLVEDEHLLGNLLSQRLEKEGFEVVLARDGEEVLTHLKSASAAQALPDLMLMDVIMPKMSGFEVLEKLKADAVYTKIPVMIISNLGQESDIERAKSLGAVDHFVKAEVSIEDLVTRTKEYFTPKETANGSVVQPSETSFS